MEDKIVKVKNLKGTPDTDANIIHENNIDYIPKVSVIIPVYNTEKYLRECLDSVVNQTLKEIEIICVDDGSTDNSLEILKEYAKKDKRISVLAQKNLHAGIARNAGLSVAKGEFLSFLDSDDLFKVDMLETAYHKAINDVSDVVIFQYNNYNEYNSKIENIRGINFKINNDISYSAKELKNNLFSSCNPMPWNKLFKTTLIKKENIKFQDLKASNDIFFSLLAMACAQKITYIQKSLCYYRYNRISSLKNTRDNNPYCFFYAYKELYDSLIKKNKFNVYKKTFFDSLCSTTVWTLNHTYISYTTLKDFIITTLIPYFKLNKQNKKYLTVKLKRIIKRKSIIVSLTSYPARIDTVYKTIESILEQSLCADKVILWLAPEQFPNKENDLPLNLLKLKEKGLVIDWYHDIKSYKKLIPTLQKFPNEIIVTADDDNIYPVCWLDKLYKSYKKHPKDIHCHRVTKVIYNNKSKDFNVVSGGYDYYKNGSFLNKLVGLGGVLYPPHSLNKDILDENLFLSLAPTNDDQWFWFQAILNNRKVRVCKNPEVKANYIEGTQNVGLFNINDNGEKLFWKDFSNLLNYYPNVRMIFIQEFFKQNLLDTFQNIFNITNLPSKEGKWYKVIYVFGIKFSFRNRKKENKVKYEKYYKLKNCPINKRPEMLKEWYFNCTCKNLNLENPQTFNEKIQWLKLYDSTPLKTRLADKYLVRDWVKEKIGDKYLIPLLGVWNKFDDIDFDKLPSQFVLKCNHGCGYNIIVKDKSKLNLKETKDKINTWLNEDFSFISGFEMHYSAIPRKIIAEKYIDNGEQEIIDYKFWCFNGKVHYIQYLTDRNIGLKMAFFNPSWEKQDFVYSYPMINKPIEKPICLDKMIKLAEILSKGFNHVRVDFYITPENEIKFGEMTFTSCSGICKWNKPEMDAEFGKLIEINQNAESENK